MNRPTGNLYDDGIDGSRGASGLSHWFRAFKNRNYRLFWSGDLISMVGAWMQDTALPILVLQLTDSPLAFTLTFVTRFLPTMLLSLHGGVLADRLPKRETLMVAESIQLAGALTLGILTSLGLVNVALIYVLMILRGSVDAVGRPTRAAFVMEMVGPKDLPNAVALNSTLFHTARIVGPALAAVVILTVDVGGCFYLNAVSFLGSIGALLAMRRGELYPVERAPRHGVVRQLLQGVRYAVSTRDVLVVLVIVAAIGTFGYNLNTILPLVSEYILDWGAVGLSTLLIAAGVGSVVAGLLVAYRGRPALKILLLAEGALTLLLVALGQSRWRWATVLVTFLLGLSGIVFSTTAMTRIQLIVPDQMRGRVTSIYLLLFTGSTAVGALLVGVLAEKTGVANMILEIAGLCAVGVGVGLWMARKKRSEAQ